MAQDKDVSTMVFASVARWLFLPGIHLTLTVSILVLYATLALVSGLVVAFDTYRQGGRGLKKYVRAVMRGSRELSLYGFAQQSVMQRVNVPLDEVFIHLNALSDRPRHDMPAEQKRLLEKLREQADMSEELSQALREMYYSQIGRSAFEARRSREARVEEVVAQLSPALPFPSRFVCASCVIQPSHVASSHTVPDTHPATHQRLMKN